MEKLEITIEKSKKALVDGNSIFKAIYEKLGKLEYASLTIFIPNRFEVTSESEHKMNGNISLDKIYGEGFNHIVIWGNLDEYLNNSVINNIVLGKENFIQVHIDDHIHKKEIIVNVYSKEF